MFAKLIRTYWAIILIILLAIFFRFLWLDKIPNALGGDEIVYILNSKALFLTGSDIFGNWSPLQGLLFQYPQGETQAELPYLLNSIAMGILPSGLFAAHITNAVLGILLVIFVYLITRELLGSKAAVFAALIASINPWFVYIGRTAYEATPSMLFYFISFYILLKAKGWKILWAFPFLVFAFYSYIATKLILLPFVFAIIVFCYFYINKKKYLKQYLALFALCIVFVAFFVVSLKLNPQTARLDELLTPNNPEIANEVNTIRKESIQNSLTNLLVNKYSVFTSIVAIKTLKTFSFDFLFVNGDEFFSIWRHGLFYYIDSLFLILGLLFMFVKKRKVLGLLSVLILIGAIPQVLHTVKIENFSIHATMAFAPLTILIGFGIWETINYFTSVSLSTSKKLNVKYISAFIILVLYFVSALNFANIYFFWHPLRGYFDFPIRVVSSYAVRALDSQKITIYSTSSFDLFKKYLFYSNKYDKTSAQTIKNNLKTQKYSLGNVTFKACNLPIDLKNKDNLLIIDAKCGNQFKDLPHISVSSLKDGGETFRIYNDKLCKGVGLDRFIFNYKLEYFNIELLSKKDFCHNFITSL